MKKDVKKGMKKLKLDRSYLVLWRYIILLGLIFTLPIIYKIFTPLTAYPVAGLLNLFYESVNISQNLISVNSSLIELIPACIAGSAYLLLLILNLSTPMGLKKRIHAILASFALLLVLNILRIMVLAIFYLNNYSFFDVTHKLFWYGLSTIFVVGIWFWIVKIFAIKQIPVYSDIKYFIQEIKSS